MAIFPKPPELLRQGYGPPKNDVDLSGILAGCHSLEELPAVVADTPEWSPDDKLQYKPFPDDIFPMTVRQYVIEHAANILFDSGMIGPPMLTVLGTAIGDTFELRITSTWTIHPSLWTCIVVESGNRKTSGLLMRSDNLKSTRKSQSNRWLLNDKKLAKATVAKRISTTKMFFRYAIDSY